MARKSSKPGLCELNDTQSGPLAEAEAITDLLNTVVVDNATLRDNSFAILSRMLVERLEAIREITERTQRSGDNPSPRGRKRKPPTLSIVSAA